MSWGFLIKPCWLAIMHLDYRNNVTGSRVSVTVMFPPRRTLPHTVSQNKLFLKSLGQVFCYSNGKENPD